VRLSKRVPLKAVVGSQSVVEVFISVERSPSLAFASRLKGISTGYRPIVPFLFCLLATDGPFMLKSGIDKPLAVF
jgi:hypothetical protein